MDDKTEEKAPDNRLARELQAVQRLMAAIQFNLQLPRELAVQLQGIVYDREEKGAIQ